MRPFLLLAALSFRSLLRDKMFLPILVWVGMLILITTILSDLGISDYGQVVFQIAHFGLHVTGVFITLIWGSRLICEAKSSGGVEAQLSTAYPRTLWITATYLGLAVALLSFVVLFIAIWTVWISLQKFTLPSFDAYMAFFLLWFVWLVVGALVFFFGSFARQGVAVFGALCLWMLGMGSRFLSGGNSGEDSIVLALWQKVSPFWDFSGLNVSNSLYLGESVSLYAVGPAIIQAVGIMLVLIGLAVYLFETKDIH
jgi:ABC-type transport system involved in multi-copper enzyme maturation permease subunit